MTDKIKTLSYFRATWNPKPYGIKNFAQFLIELFGKLSTLDSSRIVMPDTTVVETRDRLQKQNDRFYLHCVRYSPGGKGSVVPTVADEEITGPVEIIAPPDDTDFLEGAIMLMVSGDHILVCSDGLGVQTFQNYIKQICATQQMHSDYQSLALVGVASRDVVERIGSGGVAQIGLTATLDELDPNSIAPSSMTGRIKKNLSDMAQVIFGRDINLDEFRESDRKKINANLVFKLDGRGDAALAQEEFNNIAETIVEDREPGFYIKTRKGVVISHESIRISQKVKMEKQGSSVNHRQAWSELDKFFSVLSDEFRIGDA